MPVPDGFGGGVGVLEARGIGTCSGALGSCSGAFSAPSDAFAEGSGLLMSLPKAPLPNSLGGASITGSASEGLRGAARPPRAFSERPGASSLLR